MRPCRAVQRPPARFVTCAGDLSSDGRDTSWRSNALQTPLCAAAAELIDSVKWWIRWISAGVIARARVKRGGQTDADRLANFASSNSSD